MDGDNRCRRAKAAMIKFGAVVKSKYNGKKIAALKSALPDAVKDGLERAGNAIAERVRANVSPWAAGNSAGELRDSIHYEFKETQDGKAYGVITTGLLPQALTFEFGSGIYSEAPGGSRASKIPWFVHESVADLSAYWEPIEVNTGTKEAPHYERFYRIYGAKPHSFMRKTVEELDDQFILHEIAQAIRDVLARL